MNEQFRKAYAAKREFDESQNQAEEARKTYNDSLGVIAAQKRVELDVYYAYEQQQDEKKEYLEINDRYVSDLKEAGEVLKKNGVETFAYTGRIYGALELQEAGYKILRAIELNNVGALLFGL